MVQRAQQQAQPVAVGTSIARVDGPDKVTGRARYAGDQGLPGMLHARLVLSPYAHARILSIDTSAALSIPGVVCVYTAETLGMAQVDPLLRSQSPLAQGEVYWCGHPVAIVVAETEAIAQDGVDAVEVDYDPLPVVIDPELALHADSPLSRSRPDSHLPHSNEIPEHAVPTQANDLSQNVLNSAPIKIGDIEAGLREADVVIERSYRTYPVHQSYMEPLTVTVAPSLTGHHLTIWSSTQGLLAVRDAVAQALGIPARQISVEPVTVGGGFGGKETLIEPLAAVVAYRLHKPVRLVYTRQDDLLAANPAPQLVISVKLGAKKDGTLTAIQARLVVDSGAYPDMLSGFAGFNFSFLYRCPNIDTLCHVVQTNKPGTGAYRAPTGPQTMFAFESTIQDLCEQLGMDPIEFRRLNVLQEGEPSFFLRGPLPPIGMLECIEQIQRHPLWVQREQAKQDVPEELKDWKVGIGMALGGWPGGTEPAAALCRLEKDGSLTAVVGSVDLSGSDTSFALIAAEELGVPVADIYVAHDSSGTMPHSGLAAGSKTTYTVGAAVQAAAREARTQILTIAAEMLEAATEDLEFQDGRVTVRGVPEKHVTLQQIAASSMSFGAPYEPVLGRGRSANRTASPMYTAHLAKVAVDPETGEVRVLDYVAAQDVGRAINPAEVEGQMHGGIVQGIGWALFEGMAYDEDGQLLTATLMDYALPQSKDVPNITTMLVEVPSQLGPFGARGAGEPPVVPVAAAIANAIKDAVGVRMTQIPMTPERVFSALGESS